MARTVHSAPPRSTTRPVKWKHCLAARRVDNSSRACSSCALHRTRRWTSRCSRLQRWACLRRCGIDAYCRVFRKIASWVCAAAFVGITVRMPCVPTVAQVVQYNNIEPHNVTQICDAITSSASPLDGVAELVNAINSQSPTFTCVTATYTDYVAQLQNTSFVSAGAASRAWRYQTCAEFAYFQSTDGSSQAFGDLIPVSSFDQLCVDVFGAAFNASTIVENVAWTNSVYGGTDVEASNIVFPNGR